MKRRSWILWTGCAALLAAATPATADPGQSDECRWQGEEIVCPAFVLEELRETFLELEEELARARAGLARCDGEVTLLEAALASRPQAHPTPAWRPLVTLPILTLAAGGGACLAGDGCPLAAGWMGIALAVGAAIVGGLW